MRAKLSKKIRHWFSVKEEVEREKDDGEIYSCVIHGRQVCHVAKGYV